MFILIRHNIVAEITLFKIFQKFKRIQQELYFSIGKMRKHSMAELCNTQIIVKTAEKPGIVHTLMGSGISPQSHWLNIKLL